MDLYLYNTLTKQKERFKPLKQYDAKVYTCGPTVYNYAHVGNLRTYIFEDVLLRTMRYFDYRPTHVMNITDIDDKTIQSSQESGQDLMKYTQTYLDAFLEDLEDLNIQPADKVVRVTEYIDAMQRMIQTMINRENAYLAEDGSVYFSIKSFPKYGKLSGLDLSSLKEWARVDQDEFDKESAGDFVLWKAWKESDGDNFYEVEFEISGEKRVIKGRPGWHIECSAVNITEFGKQIDIHCGAVDNVFPHHECEIAQMESVTRKPFCGYWVHAEHLMVEGKKMAKSSGNFYTLRDLVDKGYTPRSFRYLCLQTHYRNQLNLVLDNLSGAESALQKIDKYVSQLQEVEEKNDDDMLSFAFSQEMLQYNADFLDAIADDLNTAQAIAVIWDLMKNYKAASLSSYQATAILDFIDTIVEVLGIEILSVEEETLVDQDIPQDIQDLAQQRWDAKQAKDYDLADSLRDQIQDQGFSVQEDAEGFQIFPIK